MGGGGPPPADVWAAALGAAAARGEAALTALTRALASAPPGSAADAGPELAAALAGAAEEAARSGPPFHRAKALRPLAMLAPRVPVVAAGSLSTSIRAAADRLAARGHGRDADDAAAAAEVLHALADRFSERGAGGGGGGGPLPRSALARAPASAAPGARRISFATVRGVALDGEDEEEEEEDAISEDEQPPPARVAARPLVRRAPPPGRAGLSASESEKEEDEDEDELPAVVPTAEQVPGGGGGEADVRSEPVRRVRQRV